MKTLSIAGKGFRTICTLYVLGTEQAFVHSYLSLIIVAVLPVIGCKKSPKVGEQMVRIPAGAYQMGDNFNEGIPDELPVHTVTLSSFYMSRYETTNAEYCQFLNSALHEGSIAVDSTERYVRQAGGGVCYCGMNSPYAGQIDFSEGVFTVRAKGARDMGNDPVVDVTWYGAAAYCNWRSLREGRRPCYDVSTWTCDPVKNGYHLPTEAQWEYAARGALSGKRFPWGDTITHDNANYRANGGAYPYDTSPSTTPTYHPAWNDGVMPYTSPVGTFAANGYGLYDMAGNVWEWCNDWYHQGYYASGLLSEPTGPATGTHRVARSSGWTALAFYCRLAIRGRLTPDYHDKNLGFRVAL